MKPTARLAAMFGIAAMLASVQHVGAQQPAALKVESIPPPASGTMHYAAELRLSVGDSAPLVLTSDVGRGRLIPVPGPQFAIDDRHVLLLGWSSPGGGMHSLCAMLLRVENGRVELRHELMLTAARASAPLIVRRSGPDQIHLGIGEPDARPFNEGDWRLVVGPGSDQRLDIGGIRKLAFRQARKRDGDLLYAPPVPDIRFPARIAWFSASASGFAPARAKR